MDHSFIREGIGSQLGASLQMLENAIKMCPEEHWDTALNFWYISYHCIFWTDYFLSTEPSNFEPPTGFTFSEFEPGKKPDKIYSKKELLSYLEHCREKSDSLIAALTVEKLSHRWMNDYKNFSILEILIYNIRHIQHHSAQLNLLLRQTFNKAPGWVGEAETPADI